MKGLGQLPALGRTDAEARIPAVTAACCVYSNWLAAVHWDRSDSLARVELLVQPNVERDLLTHVQKESRTFVVAVDQTS